MLPRSLTTVPQQSLAAGGAGSVGSSVGSRSPLGAAGASSLPAGMVPGGSPSVVRTAALPTGPSLGFSTMSSPTPGGPSSAQPKRGPGASPPGVRTKIGPTAVTTHNLSTDAFDEMAGDMKRTFVAWLKRLETDLARRNAEFDRERQRFEEERERHFVDLQHRVDLEEDRLREERRKVELDCQGQLKQVQMERDETRRKLQDEQSRFNQEKEIHFTALSREREKHRLAVEGFETEKRKIADASLAVQTMVELNVGGVVFETSRHTLSQQRGSFLEGLLSGRHQVARDRAGRLFLDRDSEAFRTILNFLRNPSVPPRPSNFSESKSLVTEADYYGIKFFPYPLVFGLGGHNGSHHLSSMEVLDVAQQAWKSVTPMETERTYFGGAYLKGQIFGCGGFNLEYKSLFSTEVYDVLMDKWVPSADLVVPRRNLTMGQMTDRIFAIGGFDGSTLLSSVEAYDPRMRSWSLIASMNQVRSSAACATLNDPNVPQMFVIGGTCGERLRSVERYDARMNVWEPIDIPLLEVRSAACAAAVLGSLFVFGGTDNSHLVHSSLEILDDEAKAWRFGSSMSTPRFDAAAVAVSESVMTAGGQRDGEVLDTVEFYRPDMDAWQSGPPMLSARYGQQLVLAPI